jgi:hypothetical protein
MNYDPKLEDEMIAVVGGLMVIISVAVFITMLIVA